MNEETIKNTLYIYHGEYLSERVIDEIIRDLLQIKDTVEKQQKSST